VIVDDLKRAPLFGNLGDDDLGRLAGVAQRLRRPAETLLFSQGQPGEAFFLLVDGSVKVFKRLRDGRTATIRHVRPGETFAESVLFHDRYPSNCQTMTDSELVRFPTGGFRELLLAHPELAVTLLGQMAHLTVMLNQRVEELLLPVQARLARYLIGLCDDQGSRRCTLPTSKKELAARLGTVPETLSRTLDRFKRSGLLRLDGERFEVLDAAKLEHVAQL
jgi:CRP-like cAMP-binding protein